MDLVMAKISGSDVRPGMVIEHDGSRAAQPSANARESGAANLKCPRWPLAQWARQRGGWAAVKTVAVKPGKGPAYNQVELKNILDGRKLNQRFGGSDRVEETVVERRQFQVLYRQGKSATLANGLRIQVPPFIGICEKVVVSTDEFSYMRRAA
jgi:elongation factor P